MDATLLVLAAGIGSRYGGLKQIDPVGPSDEIILDYAIFDAIRAGFNKVVFVIRREIERDFKESVGGKYKGHIKIEYAFQDLHDLPEGFSVPEERAKPWGTGHAILAAKDVVKEPFAAINADDFYGRNGYQLIYNYLKNNPESSNGVAEYCMTGFILSNTLSEHGTVARGICHCGNGNFLDNVEEMTKIGKDGNRIFNTNPDGSETKLQGNEYVSLNMWGFTPSLFGHLQVEFKKFLENHISEPKAEFFIPTVVDTLIKQGQARTKVLETPDSWFGITYRNDKPGVIDNIRKLVDQGIYPNKLF